MLGSFSLKVVMLIRPVFDARCDGHDGERLGPLKGPWRPLYPHSGMHIHAAGSRRSEFGFRIERGGFPAGPCFGGRTNRPLKQSRTTEQTMVNETRLGRLQDICTPRALD